MTAAYVNNCLDGSSDSVSHAHFCQVMHHSLFYFFHNMQYKSHNGGSVTSVARTMERGNLNTDYNTVKTSL